MDKKILFVRWIWLYSFIHEPRSIGVYGLDIFSLGSDVGFLGEFSWVLEIAYWQLAVYGF